MSTKVVWGDRARFGVKHGCEFVLSTGSESTLTLRPVRCVPPTWDHTIRQRRGAIGNKQQTNTQTHKHTKSAHSTIRAAMPTRHHNGRGTTFGRFGKPFPSDADDLVRHTQRLRGRNKGTLTCVFGGVGVGRGGGGRRHASRTGPCCKACGGVPRCRPPRWMDTWPTRSCRQLEKRQIRFTICKHQSANVQVLAGIQA